MDILSMMQNPAIRDSLLAKLAQSPIDPMAAMQQLGAGAGMPGGAGAPAGGGMETPFANMLGPQTPPPQSMTPGIQAPVDPRMPVPGPPGIQLPEGGFPGGPQVPGLPAEVPTPVPGAPGVTGGDFGIPGGANSTGMDPSMMKMMMAGMQGMSGGGRAQQEAPKAAAPQHHWSPFNAELMGAPAVGQRPTLAQLIYGR